MRNSNLNLKNNSNVAHNWAHATGNMKNGSHFYYESNGVIYSYGNHAPLARNIDNRLFFMSADRWTPTTSTEHQPKVCSAIPNGATIIYMLHCITSDMPFTSNGVDSSSSNFKGGNLHEANLRYWFAGLQTIQEKFNRAIDKAYKLTEFERLMEQLETYCKYFGIDYLDYVPNLDSVINWFNGLDKVTIREQQIVINNKITECKNAKAAEERANYIETQRVNIAQWYACERSTISLPYNGYALLRYNAAKNRIQTSKQIDIPVSMALKLYDRLMQVKDNGGCNNCDIPVLDYSIGTVTNEYIIAGCHKITWDEISKVYSQIPKEA